MAASEGRGGKRGWEGGRDERMRISLSLPLPSLPLPSPPPLPCRLSRHQNHKCLLHNLSLLHSDSFSCVSSLMLSCLIVVMFAVATDVLHLFNPAQYVAVKLYSESRFTWPELLTIKFNPLNMGCTFLGKSIEHFRCIKLALFKFASGDVTQKPK